jgi:hypothetical protein
MSGVDRKQTAAATTTEPSSDRSRRSTWLAKIFVGPRGPKATFATCLA